VTARRSFFGAYRRPPRLAWWLALISPFLAAPLYGQSLGDIARQERARKQSEPQQTTHVYDNDDLTRDQILLPEDKQRIESANQTPAAVAPPTASQTEAKPVASVDTNSLPLGDIARHYRALKAARQQQAAQQQPAQSSPTEAAPPPSQAEIHLDPNVDPNTLPLGDIARYYRALKAARVQQDSQSATSKPVTAAPALAYPTFTQPQSHQVAPVAPKFPSTGPAPSPLKTERERQAAVPSTDGSARLTPNPAVATIRIRHGDTLWTLARKYLGRGRDWLLLAARNPQVANPARLRVGGVLRLPEAASASNPAPGNRIRVERGESLWELSRAQFGSGIAWTCIAGANPGLQDPNLIFAGQMLIIPTSCRGGPGPRARGSALSVESSESSGELQSEQRR
jgi:nucleoid-associated protein YgaU